MTTELDRLFEVLQAVCCRCPEIPLLAIPWMHLKHPIHAVHRKLLDSSARRPALFLRLVCAARAILSLAYACYFTGRLLQVRSRHAAIRRVLSKQRFDVLVKTWRFETGEGFKEDFYYGDLQRRLGLRGARILFLYAYPRGAGWNGPRLRSDEQTGQLHELALLPLSAPVRFVFSQWRTSLRLGRIAREVSGLESRVATQAMLDCLSRQQLLPGLSDSIFRRAMEIWKPRAVLTLYEGHAWEQLAWSAVKQVNPDCKIIGYQHTALFPHQLSMLRPSGASRFSAKPDVVLCLGSLTARMLQPAHPNSRLIPFGTFRKTARVPEGISPSPRRKTMLVLPEAHAEEMTLLFRTALRAAEMLPDHRFILRCHPILPSPQKQVRLSLGRNPGSVPNLEVSYGRGVEEDFARSSVLLYRGSSSVLYAVRYGLKPVYLRDSSLPDLDPLAGLAEWKEEAAGAEELTEILRCYASRDPSPLEYEWNVALEFVRSYAIPVDDSSLDRLVEALG